MHLPCPSRWPKLAQTQRSARCRVSASLPATLQRRCCLVTPGFLCTPGRRPFVASARVLPPLSVLFCFLSYAST